MSHEYTLERLDDWIAGELPEAERREVSFHLDACAECRGEAEALQRLLREVAALPAEVMPGRDLWAGISARIEAPAAEVIPITRARGWSPPQWLRMAAAAVVLVVSSSLATLKYTEQRAPVAVAPRPAAPATTVRAAPPVTAFAAFRPAEQDYQEAITELQRALTARHGTLSPETVRTLETNLRIIDEAIRQSRAALEKDPNSRELTDMLSSAYGQKMSVLQQAVEM